MEQYIELGKKILKEGHTEQSRVGPTIALHNQLLSFNLLMGFPLMTTKYVGHKSIINELLWYLKGTTNIKYLKEHKVHVWDKFATSDGEIGKTYSYQFRNFNGIDQITTVINQLNKFSEDGITDRRAIINLYNIADLNEMSIPPCIALIQFNIYEKNNIKYLNTSVYQRSGDFCLGVPYDIAEMALLAEIIATYTNTFPHKLDIFYSNIHIYKAHIEMLEEQLKNLPRRLPNLFKHSLEIRRRKPEELTEDLFIITDIPEGRKKYKYELF